MVHESHIKKIMKRFLILLTLGVFAGCSTESDLSRDNIETLIVEPLKIDDGSILEQVERSAMSDFGYRFANAEYANQISPYATYYISESLKYAGINFNDQNKVNLSAFLERLESESVLDLTDIFTTVMLIEDPHDVSEQTKNNISRHLNSLYVKEAGYYRLPMAQNDNVYIENIYSTFLVSRISESLNLQAKPINNWLTEAASNVFQPDRITRENSSAYVMLLKLMKTNGIEISEEGLNSVQEMFEEDLEHSLELEKREDIYLPVYLMDYLEFNLLINNDVSKNHSKIINMLCDDKGIKEGVIQEYDSFGLYASIYTLYLANYNFDKVPDFNQVFDTYHAFLLDDSIYLSPGRTESNFVDTFFVDGITHQIKAKDKEHKKDIELYAREKKDELLKSGSINIYYFLELLNKNNLLDMLEDEKKQIADELHLSLEHTLNLDLSATERLPSLNATIAALEIIGEKWSIDHSVAENIIQSFVESEDLPERTVQLTELATFMNFINEDNKKEIEEITNYLILINDLEVDNKLYIYSKALQVLKESDYPIPAQVIQITKKTLTDSQHPTGLFKGGDTIEDVVSFRNTYDALLLNEIIN